MSALGLSLVPAAALGLAQSPTAEIGPQLPPSWANQPESTAPVDEGDVEEADPLAEADEPTEDVADPVADPDPSASAGTAPTPEDNVTETPDRFNEWGLMVSPGPSFMVGPNWSATGAIARLGIIKHWWRGHFMIASGPSLSYWFAQDKVANDKIHLATFNAELMIGGGIAEKFSAYGHAVLGFGYLQAYDGATDITIKFVGGKSGAGVGANYYILPKLSVGALADFNFFGGLAVDAMVTLRFYFGRKNAT